MLNIEPRPRPSPQSPEFAHPMRKVGHDFPRDPVERQSPLAIPFNRRNLSQDEDLVDVHWRDGRARMRPTYGRKPFAQS
jgi:hypothetical protein